MGMFGKGKQSEPADLLNADVVHELDSAARKKFTGALEVTDVDTKQVASLYLFEGGLYAVALPGYVPSIPDRLRVAGTITNDQAKLLTVPGSNWPSPLAGPVAVEQGWLTAEALAALHQEYLVAGLGAVAGLAKVKVKARKGESTKDFCTLPLPIDPLFDTLRMRAGRLGAGWAAITAEGTPATIALESRHVAPPADMTLPEFAALAEAVDGHSSLDSVAYGLGLTRAEAVHMSMLLVRAGVLRVAAQTALPGLADRLLVPEAFGSVVPKAGAVVEPVVPAPEPAPEPVPAAPEPDVSGSPLLATSAVFAADQAFGQPASAEAPAPAVPLPIEPESAESGADGSAPGWAAALLAAEAVSHAHEDSVDTVAAPPVVAAAVVADTTSGMGEPAVPEPVVVEAMVPEPPAPFAGEPPTPVAADPEPGPADREPSVPLWGAAAAAAVVADAHEPAEPPVPVQPWAASTPTGALPMPAPEPFAPEPAIAAAAVVPPPPDEHVLLLRRELANSEVVELEQLLAKVTAEETDAISRASSVRARLMSAKEAVARIDTELGRSPQP